MRLLALAIPCCLLSGPVSAEPITYYLEGTLSEFQLRPHGEVDYAASHLTAFGVGIPFSATLFYDGVFQPDALAPAYPFKELAQDAVLQVSLNDHHYTAWTPAVRMSDNTADGDEAFFTAGCCGEPPRAQISVTPTVALPQFVGFDMQWRVVDPTGTSFTPAQIVPATLDAFTRGWLTFEGVIYNPDHGWRESSTATTVNWRGEVTKIERVGEPSSLLLVSLGLSLVYRARRYSPSSNEMRRHSSTM